jgi:hypothetical protein
MNARRLALSVVAVTVIGCSTGASVDPTMPSQPEPSLASASDGPTDPAGPPAAIAETQASGPIAGVVGSYALPTGGSDGPWLPAAAIDDGIRITAGTPLVIRIDGPGIASWDATYAASTDPAPDRTAALGGGQIAAGHAIEVPAPPPGAWVIAVRVSFDGGGSATYYWRVTVRG